MNRAKDRLDEVVRRIVECAHPLRVILFGSAARGELRAESDLDVLVVIPEGGHRRQTAQAVYAGIWDLGVPVDIVVATPSDLERYKDTPGLIYYTIVREGIEVYAA